MNRKVFRDSRQSSNQIHVGSFFKTLERDKQQATTAVADVARSVGPGLYFDCHRCQPPPVHPAAERLSAAAQKSQIRKRWSAASAARAQRRNKHRGYSVVSSEIAAQVHQHLGRLSAERDAAIHVDRGVQNQ